MSKVESELTRGEGGELRLEGVDLDDDCRVGGTLVDEDDDDDDDGIDDDDDPVLGGART